MSADGDTVRTVLAWLEDARLAHKADPALAALARLEAAEENCRDAETNYMREYSRANDAESQRDALAEALRRIANGYGGAMQARAALAETGLEQPNPDSPWARRFDP